ncbi:trifolitoxin immunity protein [Streptomyces armeniacus]|uniref:Trifolitoxin immunity protein n=1 Tax=Streptomyces armeniacus TaxID=83291 RepID=A0A345XT42_9ACTN|nr:phosphotransferase [Streptomyces armeniacus]AXK34808.1 trifolitoxin immunity protein [Streptomyces armeniacus]
MTGTPLPGGFVSTPVRVGDTVRRAPSPRAEYVRRLLDFLAAAGWDGAPRHLGTDDEGREVLSYLPGHVAWEPPAQQPPAVGSDEGVAEVAALVREFHDLTAGTPLAEGHEVVCHNDLSPKNTVYRARPGGDATDGNLHPVALLDWDLAAPGRRVHDVAHVCWQFLRLGPSASDPRAAGARVRLVCDAYGLGDSDRAELIEVVLWWQERCWRGIEAEAEAGEPHAVTLRATGVLDSVRHAAHWVAAHREELEAGVRHGG